MQSTTFTLETPDGVRLHVYRWLPEGAPKAIVQIAHGWAEHAARYARLAEALCARGLGVFANDHRGHGQTARSEAELGFFAEQDGWNKCVANLWLLHQHIAADCSGVPIFLFGHSLGSYMAQQFISEHGDALAGVALSATNGKPSAAARAGLLLAILTRLRAGPHGKSHLLYKLVFEAPNKAFRPNRTRFDWLSRDEREVDKYVADPLCGFPSHVQAYIDVLGGLAEFSNPRRQAQIPQSLPVYIFHGSRDPLAANVRQLLAAYSRAGLRDVTYRAYPDARHETLNETNRDEVTHDLIDWLESTLAKTPRGSRP